MVILDQLDGGISWRGNLSSILNPGMVRRTLFLLRGRGKMCQSLAPPRNGDDAFLTFQYKDNNPDLCTSSHLLCYQMKSETTRAINSTMIHLAIIIPHKTRQKLQILHHISTLPLALCDAGNNLG